MARRIEVHVLLGAQRAKDTVSDFVVIDRHFYVSHAARVVGIPPVADLSLQRQDIACKYVKRRSTGLSILVGFLLLWLSLWLRHDCAH